MNGATPSSFAELYELIWNIPEHFGGMTTAMLQRCRAFLDHGVTDAITILTLAPMLDPDDVLGRVREQWSMPSSVRIRNFWHDLRTMPDAQLHKLNGSEPDAPPSLQLIGVELKQDVTAHYAGDGRIFRRDHHRADGSVCLVEEVHKKRSRRYTLYDSEGRAVSSWRRRPDLYNSWIDLAVTVRPSVLINEHKNIGEFLVGARFESVKTCQVIHGTHMTKHREKTLKNLEL